MTGSRSTNVSGQSASTSSTPCWKSSKKRRKEMTMASSGTATVTLPTDEQILVRREFDAPKHLVYKAWTTPELVKRWWHANRGEVTVAEIDLRVGGKWRARLGGDGFEV